MPTCVLSARALKKPSAPPYSLFREELAGGDLCQALRLARLLLTVPLAPRERRSSTGCAVIFGVLVSGEDQLEEARSHALGAEVFVVMGASAKRLEQRNGKGGGV